MKNVDEFYDKYDLRNNKIVARCVYLATDDVNVLDEAKTRYGDEF